jgi:Fur family ferric uptake transcriptional regulator
MDASHERPHHDHADAEARVEEILGRLRAAGGRVTAGRRAIVAGLYSGDDHHVTAEDLAARVAVDRSTVYRTLDALERLDVVARVDLGQGRAVYHLVDHAHHHLVCERCGAVVQLDEAALDPVAAAVDAAHGFALAARRLTLTGTCRRCRG